LNDRSVGPGWARNDGSPKDVDREFATLFMVFNELGGEELGIDALDQWLHLR
jgi:hypothetical protein